MMFYQHYANKSKIITSKSNCVLCSLTQSPICKSNELLILIVSYGPCGQTQFLIAKKTMINQNYKYRFYNLHTC